MFGWIRYAGVPDVASILKPGNRLRSLASTFQLARLLEAAVDYFTIAAFCCVVWSIELAAVTLLGPVACSFAEVAMASSLCRLISAICSPMVFNDTPSHGTG